MYRVPVILLNYNSSADCAKCVGFLKKQQNVDLEIIIVDNCSRPEDAEKVRQLAQMQGCTFIESDANRGYNAGNNIGLRYAASKGYDYAMIANPDMEFPQPDFIATLVDAMEEREDVVVCGGDIVSPEGKHQNPLIRDGKLFSGNVDNFVESHFCHKLSGCCFLIKISFVEMLNYFDENVFLYCEEAILSRQVEQSGKKMYYCSEIQACHNHLASLKGNPVKRFRLWRHSRIYFIQKYSGLTLFWRIVQVLNVWCHTSLFCMLSFVRTLFIPGKETVKN